MLNRRIDAPEPDGCSRGCLFAIIVMWLSAILLGIYGFASVAKLLSR